METPVYHLDHVVRSRNDLENFDGPLDLILHLLSKNKMEIADIQISLLLDQYLEWMDRQKQLNLEVASEFISMASQLIFIKTRMLLNIRDEEAVTELEQLKAELEKRRDFENKRRLKAVSGHLCARYQIGKDLIEKAPEPLPSETGYRYVHKPEDLLKGIKNALSRGDNTPAPSFANFSAIVGREPYPVSGKIHELISRLITSGVTRFRALFSSSKSRSEVVATFLAVLELCKTRKLWIAGTQDDCTVTCIDNEDTETSVTVEFD